MRRKCLCDKTGEQKYQVLNCGLIPYTVNDLSNIIINNDNWTVKVDADENSKRHVSHIACDEQPGKRIRIDTADLESSDDINSFAQRYKELYKIIPNVAKILHSHDNTWRMDYSDKMNCDIVTNFIIWSVKCFIW